MTAIEAYMLAKKIALGAVSGIANITLNGNQLIFQFNDGSSSSMSIPLPQDGISIIKVEIDENNHLICTLSDNSSIDAGELPGGTGGGFVQVPKFSSLIIPGEDDTLYLTLDDEALYYWDTTSNKYQQIATSAGGGSADLKAASLAFDGTEKTFDLPIDNKVLSVYVNGVYLTENEDYVIDRSISPNQITFVETWDTFDLCTITWIKGGSGGEDINISLATKTDIDQMFEDISDLSLATKADIDSMFDEGGNTNGN